MVRRSCYFIATLLTITVCQAQEFDREMENKIKTEINLNRIAQSKARIPRSTFEQKRADSLNMNYFRKHRESFEITSKEVKTDFTKLHESLTEEMDKDVTVCYNFFVVHSADEYSKDLRKMMTEKDSYFYKLTATDITLSVIRFQDKLFVTILTN